MNERKLYTKEELEALIAWFGNLPDCPKEIQVDKATYIPNLAETIDRLAGQARICYENPKMQGCILLMERIKEAIEKAGGVMVVTADHGNADDMYEHDKNGNIKRKGDGEPKAKTSHSLNPVPCIIYDPCYNNEYSTTLNEGLGISSIAATLMNLLGYDAPSDYDKSIINYN